MSDNQKKIEVISGDGSELDISPVYEHLTVAKPKPKDKSKKIIIPKEKNAKKNEDKKNNK